MNLREGSLYAQVAFSAAPRRGSGRARPGVLKGGSAWMPDNRSTASISCYLPFLPATVTAQLGTAARSPCALAKSSTQVTARNLTADLQGTWPWARPIRCSSATSASIC
ncbi:hypothetical protein ACHWWK_01690 [Klebsiella pneumoniae]